MAIRAPDGANKCKVDFKITLKGDIMMVELRTTKTTENVIHFYFW